MRNFRVAHSKFGSVEFDVPVDLTAIDDICDVVIFDNKEVIVYPEDSSSTFRCLTSLGIDMRRRQL